MLVPIQMQSAAAALIAQKETLIAEVLTRLGLISDGEPYDMVSISKRCRFVIYRDQLERPDGSEVFEVDGVPRLVLYPFTQELTEHADRYTYILKQSYRFL